MRYTVIWHPDAEAKLAIIWMNASDQKAVSIASNKIERLLRSDSLNVGIDLGLHRKLVEGPLQIFYTVSPDDCLVKVSEVSYLGP